MTSDPLYFYFSSTVFYKCQLVGYQTIPRSTRLDHWLQGNMLGPRLEYKLVPYDTNYLVLDDHQRFLKSDACPLQTRVVEIQRCSGQLPHRQRAAGQRTLQLDEMQFLFGASVRTRLEANLHVSSQLSE